jgi:hypothetical protein
MQGTSFIRRYRGKSSAGEHVTFPYMTAIINVDEGDVTSITWDTGCVFCNPSECVDNEFNFDGTATSSPSQACQLPDSDCLAATGDAVATNCPLQLYVVWTGTDADGQYLTSSEMRFSSYKSYSVGSFVDGVKDKYDDVKSAACYACVENGNCDSEC